MGDMARAKNFFHGTKAELGVGDLILPAVEVNPYMDHSNYGDTGSGAGQPSRNNAYASTSWKSANLFARHSKDWHRTGLGGHVYPVEPVGESRKGHYTEFKEHLAPAWRVTGPPEHTAPVRAGYSRQGILPVHWAATIDHDIKTQQDALSDERDRTYEAKYAAEQSGDRVGMVAARDKISEISKQKNALWNAADRHYAGQEPERKIRSRQFAEKGPVAKQKPVKPMKGQLPLF